MRSYYNINLDTCDANLATAVVEQIGNRHGDCWAVEDGRSNAKMTLHFGHFEENSGVIVMSFNECLRGRILGCN